MIDTNLLGATVCFRFPPEHKGDAEHRLHKTKGTIKSVYLFNGVPRYTILIENGTLETCDNHQMIVCIDIGLEQAVYLIEKEDAER